MPNPVQAAQHLGQSIWYDNMSRALLTSGGLQQVIDLGVTGLTSNPTIFEKAVASAADYDAALLALAQRGTSTQEAYEALVIEDIRAAADLLLPTYRASQGVDGYASLEVSPALANDTEGTVAEARRLYTALGRPNVMIKVPGTPAGIPAFRRLIAAGININVTLIFSLDAYAQVREAYIHGLEELRRTGGDVSRIASVASFFVSRVDTSVDGLLNKAIAAGRGSPLQPLLGKAAIANARLAYRSFRETFDGPHFAALKAAGARPQRPLWASTGTKNPAYSDVLYVDTLIARDTVNTMPPATLTAFLDHGHPEPTLETATDDPAQTIARVNAAGISMKAVTDKLLADGVKAFADSFDALLANVARKQRLLLRKPTLLSQSSQADFVAPHPAAANSIPAGSAAPDLPARIWRGDHTVWSPNPTEITNRLGWLRMPEEMSTKVADLMAFGREVKDAGYLHVVLLGMGGSGLGPEILKRTWGSAPGYPELLVLDSTVPSRVQAVADTIDPSRTLFLVSSKSGTTIEPLSFYKFFIDLVGKAVGEHHAGAHFAAITDPDSALAKLGHERGFRRVFVNPPDIGGRYSVLSYFGLVPAALIGMDVAKFLERAKEAQKESRPETPASDNAGALLGTLLGDYAKQGRDKLTLVASPRIAGFGLWAEQLVAESTGKAGKGIVPVAGEPLLRADSYGPDRAFVRLRLAGDDNAADDNAVAAIAAAGHPVIEIGLVDAYDLGAEFFRWEMAVAVAGAVLGIHPFDQPDVQLAKAMTNTILKQGTRNGAITKTPSLENILQDALPGDYFAVLAYVRETPEMDRALSHLRAAIMRGWHIATTAGYGPRYLHSTGQLHKGGPDSGRFLVITADQPRGLPVPGESFSFNTLSAAQALGDLQALAGRGRKVAHLHLSSEDPAAVLRLAADIGLVAHKG